MLGEYRTARRPGNDQPGVAVTLKIRRGEQLIKTVTKTLPADEVPPFLLSAVGEFVNQDSLDSGIASTTTEARQLSSRAQDFSRLGNWAEALDLAEASLLLKPDQPAMRHDAIVDLTQIGKFDRWFDAVSALREKLQRHSRAYEHLRALLSD